jgi:chromosome transmission fidelity protein 18
LVINIFFKKALCCKIEKPDTPKLCNRLLDICNAEGLKTDAHTLTTLCSLMENDIRACLNALQFIRRKSKVLTKDMIIESAIGCKDLTKRIFSIWEDVFHPQQKKLAFQNRMRKNFSLQSNSEPEVSESSFHHLYELVHSHSEADKILEGCFAHYPKMRYLDTSMKKVGCRQSSVFCNGLGFLNHYFI